MEGTWNWIRSPPFISGCGVKIRRVPEGSAVVIAFGYSDRIARRYVYDATKAGGSSTVNIFLGPVSDEVPVGAAASGSTAHVFAPVRCLIIDAQHDDDLCGVGTICSEEVSGLCSTLSIASSVHRDKMELSGD